MSGSITLRYLQVGDARRFVEILNHPEFIYFPAKPESIKAEQEFLRESIRDRKEGRRLSYSILLKDKVVGAAGLKIDPERPYLGEIGYFVDRMHWGKGIACRAVERIEKEAFEAKGIIRIEILMVKRNKASIRVAEKCGYRKEGTARSKLLLFGKYEDAYVYAKIKPTESP